MTKEGKLNGVKITYYAGCGASPNDNAVNNALAWGDNGELLSKTNYSYISFIVTRGKLRLTYSVLSMCRNRSFCDLESHCRSWQSTQI